MSFEEMRKKYALDPGSESMGVNKLKAQCNFYKDYYESDKHREYEASLVDKSGYDADSQPWPT